MRVLRFGWSSVAAAQTRSAPDHTGLLAVIVEDKLPRPLVLLVDLQDANDGASLTNVAGTAISYLSALTGHTSNADWIEIDSDGCFDRMVPAFDERTRVDWQPLRADQTEPRTLEAFLAACGPAGRAAWLTLSESLEAMGIELTLSTEHDRRTASFSVYSQRIGNQPSMRP